jgi:hypothetical protein
MSKKQTIKKGLSDKELIEKYETGGRVDFDKKLKQMAKSPSHFSESKNVKSHHVKH